MMLHQHLEHLSIICGVVVAVADIISYKTINLAQKVWLLVVVVVVGCCCCCVVLVSNRDSCRKMVVLDLFDNVYPKLSA